MPSQKKDGSDPDLPNRLRYVLTLGAVMMPAGSGARYRHVVTTALGAAGEDRGVERLSSSFRRQKKQFFVYCFFWEIDSILIPRLLRQDAEKIAQSSTCVFEQSVHNSRLTYKQS